MKFEIKIPQVLDVLNPVGAHDGGGHRDCPTCSTTCVTERGQTFFSSSSAIVIAARISSGLCSDVRKNRNRPAFNGTPG